MIILIISALIYLVTSLILSRILFEKPSLARDILMFFLVTFATNVFIFEILSLVKLLNNSYAFYIGQVLVCSALLTTLLLTKRISIKGIFGKFRGYFSGFRFLDYVLVAVMAIILGGFFVVGITTPPNNTDSLKDHLPKIFYWLQHGSFVYWSALFSHQLIYPIDAHIQGLWLFLLGRKENLFFLVQWFSLVVISATVFEISRLLKFTITQALVSTLVLLSFPVVLLQTYSFQGDLTVTAPVMVCIFFTFSYLQTKSRNALILAFLAIALALGTKQTAFFVLPALGCLFIYALLTKQLEKSHIPLVSLVLVFFLVFSSYKYIQNLVETNRFFGDSVIPVGSEASSGNILEKMEYNLARYSYQFIGFDGVLGTAEKTLVEAKAQVMKPILGFLHLDLEKQVYLPTGYDTGEDFSLSTDPLLADDTAWFGPLCFLSILLGVIFTALSKDKARREYLIFALLLNLSYVVITIFQRPGWDPYQGRYFILGTIPLLPLVSSWIPKNRIAKIPVMILVSIATVFLAMNTLLFNDNKPLITGPSITEFRRGFVSNMPNQSLFQKTVRSFIILVTNYQYEIAFQRNSIYDESYYEQLFHNNVEMVPEINWVNSIIPEGAPIAILMEPGPLEYALFGINQTRNLFPISNIAQVKIGGILLIQNPQAADLSGFTLLASDAQYSIYQRKK